MYLISYITRKNLITTRSQIIPYSQHLRKWTIICNSYVKIHTQTIANRQSNTERTTRRDVQNTPANTRPYLIASSRIGNPRRTDHVRNVVCDIHHQLLGHERKLSRGNTWPKICNLLLDRCNWPLTLFYGCGVEALAANTLQFWNGWIISSPTVLCVWLLIHTKINISVKFHS